MKTEQEIRGKLKELSEKEGNLQVALKERRERCGAGLPVPKKPDKRSLAILQEQLAILRWVLG